MHICRKDTGSCKRIGKISTDDIHAFKADDRIDNRIGAEILAYGICRCLSLCLAAGDGRHIKVIVDVGVRGHKVAGNNAENYVVISL